MEKYRLELKALGNTDKKQQLSYKDFWKHGILETQALKTCALGKLET